MSICYKPYVSSHKRCKKTTMIERVTCSYCINQLIRKGEMKAVPKEAKE